MSGCSLTARQRSIPTSYRHLCLFLGQEGILEKSLHALKNLEEDVKCRHAAAWAKMFEGREGTVRARNSHLQRRYPQTEAVSTSTRKYFTSLACWGDSYRNAETFDTSKHEDHHRHHRTNRLVEMARTLSGGSSERHEYDCGTFQDKS